MTLIILCLKSSLLSPLSHRCWLSVGLICLIYFIEQDTCNIFMVFIYQSLVYPTPCPCMGISSNGMATPETFPSLFWDCLSPHLFCSLLPLSFQYSTTLLIHSSNGLPLTPSPSILPSYIYVTQSSWLIFIIFPDHLRGPHFTHSSLPQSTPKTFTPILKPSMHHHSPDPILILHTHLFFSSVPSYIFMTAVLHSHLWFIWHIWEDNAFLYPSLPSFSLLALITCLHNCPMHLIPVCTSLFSPSPLLPYSYACMESSLNI